jgi:TonB-linked SusC/RagA family outer membrane protein
MKICFPTGKEPLSIKGSLPNQMKLRVIFVFLFSLFSSFIFAQRTVTGQVTSGDTALAGVTVQVKGTQATTQTDADGKFSISASPNATLVFTFVGYGSIEEKLGNRTFLPVQLQSALQQLGEVVVVGYGTQRKRDITGAVSTVKIADLNQTNAVSIDNLLQGRAAGLNVATNTAQPGGAVNINIRGAISPRGDNSPLYVIDGLPITTNASTELNSVTGNFRGGFARSPLDNINPNDIESVDILKDASATAIYGSAAANGVILITTKRGKEGRASVNYSGTYSIQNRKKYLETLNAVEFRNSVNTYGLEFFKFNNRLAPYGNGTTPLTNYKPYFTPAQVAETNQGMNYIDYVLRQGRVNDHNISVSSGNANTKIFTSFNYYNQQGLLRNSDFSRYSTRVNLDQRLSSVVIFNLGLSYSQVNSNNVPTGQSGDIDSPSLLQSALQFAPDIAPFDSTGKPNPSYYARTPNPASFFQILNKNFSRRFVATPNLQINITRGLKVNITGGIDNTNTDRQFFIPVRANFSTVPQGNAQMGLTKLSNYSTEAYASYDKAFTNSRFSGVAGVGYYASAFSDFGLNAVGFSTDVFGVNNIGIANNRLQSSQSSNRTARNKLSQFTRLNYTLMDKYIFQFTGRFDGTSNFPQKNLFGFFPGVSAGWVMTEENFLKDTRWLNQLKLRAGYGTSGNESITTSGNYVYSLYSLSSAYSYLIGNQLYNTGFFQTQLGNEDLKWETDVTFNVGVDFGLFNNKLSGSVDYFRRTAKDLLDFRVLPASNPITTQAFNVGSTRSTGLELTLRSENFSSKNFSWSTLLTLGTSKAYWVERNPAVTLPKYVGYNDPIRAVYGWKTNGLVRSASDIPKHQSNAFVGNIKYEDLNGDGKLDIDDVTYLGTNDPKSTFGLNNQIKFKNLDLSFFIYGAYGNFTNDGYATFVQLFRLTRPGSAEQCGETYLRCIHIL